MFSRKITVAQSWSGLNEWQIAQIAHLYLHSTEENFAQSYEKMIFAVFQKQRGIMSKLKLYKTLRQVPISEMGKHTQFLLKETNLYTFPEIPGLLKPADRLGNISIKQYSAIDSFFYAYDQDRTELKLNRFVASLYRLQEDYDELLLPEVSKITSALHLHTKERIALAYKFTTFLLWKLFPVVFPPKKEEETPELQPVFKKKENRYIPFEKIMIGLAMDELQPMGKKQDIDKTRIYEFMNVLTESILFHKERQKQHEKANK